MAQGESPYIRTCAVIVLHSQFQPYNSFSVRPILNHFVPETQNFNKFGIHGIVGIGLSFWYKSNTV